MQGIDLMKSGLSIAVLALTFVLAACAGGGDMADTVPAAGPPAPRVTDFDGEVLRISVPHPDGGRDNLNSLRDEWYSWSWFPFMPNHAGRRWTLGKTDRDGVTLAYALISWDNDDPADYLSAGFWMRFDGATTTRHLDPAGATIVPFVDGPELDPAAPPDLPLTGTASYAGSAGGVYRYRTPGAAEPVAEEFAATITLEADFAAGAVAGCIGCVGDIALEREHLYAILGWRRDQGATEHPPAGYEIRFGLTPIGEASGFEGERVSVSHPDRDVTRSGGLWSGQFSSRPAADGTPRLVAGEARATFAEADGAEGSFDSIFTALHPELLPAQSEE
jgi:hypothetical protein